MEIYDETSKNKRIEIAELVNENLENNIGKYVIIVNGKQDHYDI